MQNEQSGPHDEPCTLTHRIRNLEQENLILKRYLSEIPLNLGSIIALESEDIRRAELETLQGRLNRFSARIALPDALGGTTARRDYA